MPAGPTFAELLRPHASGAALERLVRYAQLLERWSTRHNLVRFATRDELVTRHIVDALAAAPFLGASGDLLDVGSGAGLPGVPLLAACPGWVGTLLEPRHKRWAFLKLVVRELGLSAEVVRERFEALPAGRRWHCITARAVGRDEALLRWAETRLQPDGEVMLWTTTETAGRLEGLRAWRVLSSALPGLERGRLCRLHPCFT